MCGFKSRRFHTQMAYEIYHKKLNRADYFSKWDSDNFTDLTDAIKERIYEKYLLKCEVFIRDSFKCQNTDCRSPESPLTMHHIKWQKNGGKDTERNNVTLCRACHMRYHKGKGVLIFANSEHLPAHIRGHTFKITKEDKIDWKKVRSEMRTLRKNLKLQCGLRISWDQIAILMKFLEMDINEFED